jgi:hypothetical protein
VIDRRAPAAGKPTFLDDHAIERQSLQGRPYFAVGAVIGQNQLVREPLALQLEPNRRHADFQEPRPIEVLNDDAQALARSARRSRRLARAGIGFGQ